ncbi:MAG: tetratricopeptide repeat protein [Endomicrobia bacterium]|nr:tetratricopeptide repeat protein [Endomicrobiia bacterium]MDW8055190.1 tetratricopeptide repeat protein [Elusimicrobiota bacterium]
MKKLMMITICLLVATYLFYFKIYRNGVINNILQKYPSSLYAQGIEYYLGYIFLLIGRNESAIFRFKRVIDNYNIDKFKPASYYDIAQIYEDSKKHHQAIKIYKLIFEKYPNNYYGGLAKKRYEYLLLIGYKDEEVY